MENNNIEKNSQPINKIEEAKNNERKQLADFEVNLFLDTFMEKNEKATKSKDKEELRELGETLKEEIKNFIIDAMRRQGKDYADLVKGKFFACLTIYRPIIADDEKDSEVKFEAKKYILDLFPPVVQTDEGAKLEY